MSEARPPNRAAVALFIDLENIRYSFQNVTGGFEPDLSAFMKIGQRYGRVVHAAAFADFSKHPDKVKTALNVAGISIRDIPLKTIKRGNQDFAQSSADMHMVMDIYETVINQPGVETFVICTGDGDFLRIVTTLRNHYDKRVTVVAVPTTISSVLESAADETVLLDMPDPILGGNNNHRRFENGTAKTFEELKHIIEPIIILMKKLPPNMYWTLKMLDRWVGNPRNQIPGTHTDRASAISFMVNNNLILREKKQREGRGEITESELNENDPVVREVLIRNGLLVVEPHHAGTQLTSEERQERVADIRGSLEKNGLLDGISPSTSSVEEEVTEPSVVSEELPARKPARRAVANKTATKKTAAKKSVAKKPADRKTARKAS